MHHLVNKKLWVVSYTRWHKKTGTFEMRGGSHVQLAALQNRDLELQTTLPFSNHGSVERQVVMVQFLSIKFFCWISTIFVGFFKSSRFFVSSCISSWVAKFVNFNALTLVFLGTILSNNYSSFEQNSNFISYQIFWWDVKFWKCSFWNFRYVSYFLLFVKMFFLLVSSFLSSVECKNCGMCKYVLLHHAAVEGCVELVHFCPLVCQLGSYTMSHLHR
jgi:hypothetical protein